MTRRNGRSGMTLIEILLSLLVFVVGIVGVLALFPTAMYTSQQSIQEARAAMLAESVKNALTQALRTVKTAASGTNPTQVLFIYDFKRQIGTGAVSDAEVFGENNEFPLPTLMDGWRRYPVPGGSAAPTTTPQTLPDSDVFRLMGSPWLNATHQYTMNANDPSENYDRWSFFFDVRKVNTMPWDTLANADPKIKLYEFTIYICRRVPTTTSSGTGTGSSTSTGWTNEVVLRVSDRVTLK